MVPELTDRERAMLEFLRELGIEPDEALDAVRKYLLGMASFARKRGWIELSKEYFAQYRQACELEKLEKYRIIWEE